MWKKVVISFAIFLLAVLVVRSVYSTPQVVTEVKPVATATPAPTATPVITEIDTRDQKQVDAFNEYFTEYCKKNDCNTPVPSPSN